LDGAASQRLVHQCLDVGHLKVRHVHLGKCAGLACCLD
jgi:hypothetical protein